MKKILIYVLLITLMSKMAWPMQSRAHAPLPTTYSGTEASETLALNVGIKREHRNYLIALWSVMLVHHQRSGLFLAPMSKTALLKAAQEYVFATYGKSIDPNPDNDLRHFEELLKTPGNIYFAFERRLVNGFDSQMRLEFFYQFGKSKANLFTKARDINLSDGAFRWDPLNASIKYVLATNQTDVLRRWIKYNLQINRRFPVYQNATMLHLAATCAEESVSMFLIELGADCSMLDNSGTSAYRQLLTFGRKRAAKLCEARMQHQTHTTSTSAAQGEFELPTVQTNAFVPHDSFVPSLPLSNQIVSTSSPGQNATQFLHQSPYEPMMAPSGVQNPWPNQHFPNYSTSSFAAFPYTANSYQNFSPVIEHSYQSVSFPGQTSTSTTSTTNYLPTNSTGQPASEVSNPSLCEHCLHGVPHGVQETLPISQPVPSVSYGASAYSYAHSQPSAQTSSRTYSSFHEAPHGFVQPMAVQTTSPYNAMSMLPAYPPHQEPRAQITPFQGLSQQHAREYEHPLHHPHAHQTSVQTGNDLGFTRINMCLNPKYLAGVENIPSPIARTSEDLYTPDEPHPSFTFSFMPIYTDGCYVEEGYLAGAIQFRILSTKPNQLTNNFSRTTFVLAGRGQYARVPQEDVLGRVVLVVPKRDEFQAHLWLGSHRDVIIVDALWDQFGRPIKDIDLGLVTSRRLAVMYLAHYFGLPHLMMLDDNLENFYFSNHLAAKPTSWPEIYELFRSTATAYGSTVLSAQMLKHRMLRVSLNADRIYVNKNTQASKIFFIDMNQVKKSISTPNGLSWLFPLKLDVCGEDIFLQSALSSLNHSVDSFSVQTLAYSRSAQDKHSARHTIAPATYWQNQQSPPPHAPHYHHVASSRMVDILRDNIERIRKKNEERQRAHLPSLTAHYSAIRAQKALNLANHDTATERYVSNVPIGQKRKRFPTPQIYVTPQPQTDTSTQYTSSFPVVSNRLTNKFKNTIETILYSTNNKTRSTSQPSPSVSFGEGLRKHLRPHQLEAITALYEHLSLNRRSGFFELPTGAGKTRIFLTLLAMALQTEGLKDKHIAILIPSIELVQQTYDAIEIYNTVMEPYGLAIPKSEVVSKISSRDVSQNYLQYNYDFLHGKPQAFIFCDQSFKNLMTEHPRFYEKFSMIIIDEFHATPEGLLREITNIATYQELLLFGFSATPADRDAYFDFPIYYLSIEDAVKQKVLVPWKIVSLGEWEKDNHEKWANLARALKTRRHPSGKLYMNTKTIISVSNTTEANSLAYLLSKEGIKAHVYTHMQSKAEQRQMLSRFALRDNSREQIDYLITVKMLNMGFDGQVETAILAKMTSLETAIQFRGRALRPDKNDLNKVAVFMAPQDMFMDYDLAAPNENAHEDIPLLCESPAQHSNSFIPEPTGNPVTRIYAEVVNTDPDWSPSYVDW